MPVVVVWHVPTSSFDAFLRAAVLDAGLNSSRVRRSGPELSGPLG